MKKSKFTEAQIAFAIKQSETDKVEYCVFDPFHITITRKDFIASLPQNEYLTVLPANSRQIENIIKALKSKDEREINLLCKLLHKISIASPIKLTV
jgi:hypothetical protein